MRLEDKERLLVELKKYYNKNYKNGVLESAKLNLGLSLIDEYASDKKSALKALLKNEHGLIGNLIYKYILNPEKDILDFIKKNDKKIIYDGLKKYRNKIIWENGLSNCFIEMLWIIDYDEGYINDIGYFLKNDSNFYFEIAKSHPSLLGRLKHKDIRDKDLIIKCISANPESIKYLPPWVKKDREIVLEAIRKNGRLLLYTCAFFSDKKIVVTAVKSNGMALESAASEFRDDEEIVKIAISNSPWAYRNVSERLRDNKEITLIAVKGNGGVLVYASERLKNDKTIVYAAVKSNPFAFKHVGEKYKDDKNLAIIAVKGEALMYKYVSERLKKDIDIINSI